MFALLLCSETDLELDIGHVLELALVHDLVEIYAGDTYVHLTADRIEAMVREQEAAERLFPQLPPDLARRLRSWWDEFELGESPEARFARAMDRLQGFAQNIFAGGRVWRERAVTEEMTRQVNRDAIELHPVLDEVYRALYERATGEDLWPRP